MNTPRRFDPTVPEMMDRPGNDPALLRADLDVLETINRRLGGYRIPLNWLAEFARGRDSLSILDLATGGADVPRAIARWNKRRGLRITITAVDGNPEILEVARERIVNYPEIQLQQHNLLALPFAPNSFDFVLCSLALHHFADADVVAILRRVADIARVGFVVNDLRRHPVALALSKLIAHTIIRNPIARFDAPASCERAFTVAELRALAERAGLTGFRIRRHWAFRMALVGVK